MSRADGTPIGRRAYLGTATAALSGVGLAGCTAGDPDESEPTSAAPDRPGGFEIERVATGLAYPWGMAFVDASTLLVTERPGALALVDRDDGTIERLDGVPEVDPAGQGGLLDVTLHPEFPEEPWVYLTYAASDGTGGSATHVGRGRLDREAGRLVDVERLFVATPFVESNKHYGSRIVVGEDGALYVTCGDRHFKDFGPDHVAQDRTNALGTTVRLALDGSIPDDNPFVDTPDARDAIFSYGHRNPQGMTVHPETGAIWQAEHGEQDGDEINVVRRGGNYGWPVATEACTYGGGEPIGVSHADRDDVVDPVHVWPCGSGGFPPSGMTVYDGDAFPDWRGDLFVGNLAGRYLGRFTVDGRDVTEVEPLLDGRGSRIRAVADAPDTGHIYVAVDADDAPVLRLVPP